MKKNIIIVVLSVVTIFSLAFAFVKQTELEKQYVQSLQAVEQMEVLREQAEKMAMEAEKAAAEAVYSQGLAEICQDQLSDLKRKIK